MSLPGDDPIMYENSSAAAHNIAVYEQWKRDIEAEKYEQEFGLNDAP